MRKLVFYLCSLLFSLSSVCAQSTATVRILLGSGDKTLTRWDGTLQTEGGTTQSIEPWRFEGVDGIVRSTWHISTHVARQFAGSTPALNGGVVPNGIIVTVSSPSGDPAFKITTAQGDFNFRLSETAYGRSLQRLEGRVLIDRIPPTTEITRTKDEEDFPSAAATVNGDVWVAYLQFKHSPQHSELRAAIDKPSQDFSKWSVPAGGDRVFARHYANGRWEEPIAVTASGLDIWRTSVAVDGQGRPWVFWAQNSKFPVAPADFNIYARPLNGNTPGAIVQISKEAGSDIDAVAATDSSGKVWVAWQGWRNGRAAIFAASQSGDGFTAPTAVSNSTGNEWNPAIAADKNGRVTVAWDSYRNGNYDVYARTQAGGKWNAEFAVAASARYEAYPSIAYESTGRLWIAYEEGGKGWGKDFGAYNTKGVAVYQGRAIRLRGIEPDGKAVETAADVDAHLPGFASLQIEKAGVQKDFEALDPDPNNAQTREKDRPARNMQTARNTLPRLAVDPSGRIWLAFRSAHPIFWSSLGTVWTEHLVSYDGHNWSQPIYLNHSDNLLDNRPALAVTGAGKLLLVNSSDGRRQFQPGESLSGPAGLMAVKGEDPYDNNLFASQIELGAGASPLSVQSARALETAAPETGLPKSEAAVIKNLRDYSINSSGDLKIARGEFHRHSEISADGGSDGTIIDQYRYVLDASAMDWVGCCDHDNGGGREYTWWLSQQLTDIFYTPGKFVPMFSHERSVNYPEGHRNLIFAKRGIRPLPRMPLSKELDDVHAQDTQNLYRYLKTYNGISASHTSATSMGTDWRDNDPLSEPVVEIYQGDRQNYEMPDAPRSNSEKDSIGNWRPKGFINIALDKGYKLGFEASSDHVSTHMSYCNILTKDYTRESILDALQKRHVYGATDNILADVRSGMHIMGDAFSTAEPPSLHVKLTGTSKFSRVVIVKDSKYVYSTEPGTDTVDFSWRDNSPQPGKQSYYYVRGEQDNGELVWASPMWITFTGK